MKPQCEKNFVTDQVIIDQMVSYLETVLEKPHPVFGGLPICPFSKKARLQNRILYKVLPLSFAELQPNSKLWQAIQEFSATRLYDVLLVISPDIDALSVDEVRSLIEQVNQAIELLDLTAFGGHPEDDFNIQGVYTRQEPFINMTIQFQEVLHTASHQLKKTNYYQNWSPENLRQIDFENRF